MAKYRYAKGPDYGKIFLIVLIILVSLGIIGGAAYAVYHFTADKEPEIIETTAPTETQPPATVDEPATQAPTEDPQAKYTGLANDYMSNMSTEEKIYQMLMVTPEALTGVDVATVAGDATKEALAQYPVGGIYYSAQNFEDNKQAKDLVNKSQSYTKTPMFISVTDEGGENSPIANKLESSNKFSATIYETKGDKEIENYCASISKKLSGFGINLNFAPCVNLDGNTFPVESAKSVMDLTPSIIKGFNTNSVIPAVKYFPTTNESDKNLEQLYDELTPFAAAINYGDDSGESDAIVISANIAKGIDSEYPAFMSSKVVTDALINEYKFGGLVLSPMLTDSALADSAYTTDDIVVKSINAGVNMFVCPNDIEGYAQAIKTALQDETITQEQINNSVAKILTLKFKYGIIPEPSLPAPSEISTEVSTDVSTETAQ